MNRFLCKSDQQWLLKIAVETGHQEVAGGREPGVTVALLVQKLLVFVVNFAGKVENLYRFCIKSLPMPLNVNIKYIHVINSSGCLLTFMLEQKNKK